MNLKEQIFLILLKSYHAPEHLPEDHVKHLAKKAQRISELYQQYSKDN